MNNSSSRLSGSACGGCKTKLGAEVEGEVKLAETSVKVKSEAHLI